MTITVEEAQVRLSKLIDQLHFGEEIIITRDEKPVARLIGEERPKGPARRKLGTLKGTVRYIAPDFDAPPRRFQGVHGVRLLLDSHTLIWAADEPSRLSSAAATALQDLSRLHYVRTKRPSARITHTSLAVTEVSNC